METISRRHFFGRHRVSSFWLQMDDLIQVKDVWLVLQGLENICLWSQSTVMVLYSLYAYGVIQLHIWLLRYHNTQMALDNT